MKNILTSLALLALLAMPASAQEKTPAAAPAVPAAPEPPPNVLLEAAIKNMATLKSYHVHAELLTKAGTATLDGDLGPGTLHLHGQDPQGVRKQRLVAEQTFYLSSDAGKTWQTGGEADQDGTIFLSKLVTGPIAPEIKIWDKGKFFGTDEKAGTETLLKVEKPAAGKEPAATFWLVKEPSFDQAWFVRKVTVTIDSEAGEFPITVTYTKFNAPVVIKAPTVEK